MEDNRLLIYDKLEAFIKKYYTNELIKGSLLFLGLGLMYFISTALIEYFLWLPSIARTFLFWLFIFVEFLLLSRFILFPIFKLFKIQKGISYTDASTIIGNHFPDVNDKLINFLQLSGSKNASELLAASIQQKAASLSPIPFSNAILFSSNKKYIPYALIPLLLILFFYVSGNQDVVTNSFSRVLDYNTKFNPPAPYSFTILNKSLAVEQNNSFELQLTTVGKIIPENVSIVLDDEEYIMESNNTGTFNFTFNRVTKSQKFYFKTSKVTSQVYTLQVINIPTITDYTMILNYPSYTKRKSETIKGTGNAIVPEGTSITWSLNTLSTNRIDYKDLHTLSSFYSETESFKFTKRFTQNTEYQLITSNKQKNNFETFSYQITVQKDQYPIINTQSSPDSLNLSSKYIIGSIADDFGFSKLQIVYYPVSNKSATKRANLLIKGSTVDQFIYSFPNGLQLQPGFTYEYYFEVFDNDVVNGYKSSKSPLYSQNILTDDEKKETLLKDQTQTISNLSKSLQAQNKQMRELEALEKLNKEKSNLDYKDQKKIQDFLNRQKEQEEMMKEYSKKLKDNLEKFNPNELNKTKEELIRRLENTQKESEKNERLLQELEDLQKKLQKEELFDKANQLKQNSRNQQKNLEQLVELTKRFYVEEKAKQISDKLDKLSEKQENLSNSKENSQKEQEKLSKEFNELSKDLKDLQKENESLKNPLEIPTDTKEQQDIQEDQQNAEEQLRNNQKEKAKSNQKSAAQKMKQMSQKMQQDMMDGDMQQMSEDIKTLRQILDNLLDFSFNQEALIKPTKDAATRSLELNRIIKKQQDLKDVFRHIDDSIFAISLRNDMIKEFILNEVGTLQYNLDSSLESLSENFISKGASHQQYTLTSANKLAEFLSNVKSQMSAQMSGQGQGKPKPGQGQGMQLSDIIKKQEGLSEKLKDGMKQQGNQSQQKSNNEGEGSEGDSGKLMEILKEQQQLRDALQKELEKNGLNGSKALSDMRDIEKQLIQKGFKNETVQKMLLLKHELLKLENALQQQGEDSKRKSNTNTQNYQGTTKVLPKELQDYIKSIEILNRQTLPLQPMFENRIQRYFKNND